MPQAPVCSVIVPNYNHSSYLEKRLQSILNQTFQEIEIILLDDASTDNSKNILEKYSNHPKVSHFIENTQNSGSTFLQWNRGIALAKGDFVWIAESDDYCENDFLEKLIHYHYNNPDIALSFCQSFRMNAEGVVTGSWKDQTNHFPNDPFKNDFIMDGNRFIELFLIHKNVIPNVSAVVFKKNDLKKILLFPVLSIMKYNADWFYYIMVLCNSKIGYIAEPLNYFRYHENSVIAKATDESGWRKILAMELEVRKKMINYLKESKVSNFKRIKKEYKKGNNKLMFLITKIFIENEELKKGLLYALPHPAVLKKLIPYFLKRFNS